MDDFEVWEGAFEREGVFIWMSSEAVEQVAFDPVVEVVGCDDGRVASGFFVELQPSFSAFGLGARAFCPNFAFSFDSQFFAELQEFFLHDRVLGAQVMVEVECGEFISFPSQPEEGRDAICAHADGEVVVFIFGQDAFDDFDHSLTSRLTNSPPSSSNTIAGFKSGSLAFLAVRSRRP